ncbi:fibronectin type III domain-containing protein [bacterium]|nr:fibronectin type III domain-containing protein [bacterium]
MKWLPLSLLVIFTIGILGCEDDETITGPNATPPENLAAEALSESQVRITWDDTPHETGYRIQRSIGSVSWTPVIDLSANIVTYDDTGLDEGTEYLYRIKAYNANNESEASEVATVLTLPKPPINLSAEQDASVPTTIRLTWEDESLKETGFEVQHKLGREGEWGDAGAQAADEEEFIDEGLQPNERYYYRVRSMIDDIGSLWSGETSARTDIRTPTPPSDLTAITSGSSSINLLWSHNRVNSDGFILERSLSMDSDFEWIDSLQYTNLAYLDENGLESRTTYYYRIAAYNNHGNSVYSNVASTTTDPGAPAPPSDFRASNITWNSVTLNWQDNSDDEDGFKIQRFIANTQNVTNLPDVDANLTQIVDNTVEMNESYTYRIRSFNQHGFSNWVEMEDVVTVPDGPPNPPIILSVETQSITSIRIIWRAGLGSNQNGFILERKDGPGGIFSSISGDLPPNTTLYEDINLDIGVWYYYRIYAFNAQDRSAYSNIDSARTLSNLVLEDDFEGYGVNLPPSNPPWETASRGGSSVLVSANTPHEGEKCLEFIDPNPTPTDTAYCSALLTSRNLLAGSFTMWLKLAPNGYFGINGGDATNILTFRIWFFSDTLIFQNGPNLLYRQGYQYPVGEWFKLDIEFDTRSGFYSLFINETDLEVRDATLRRGDLHPNNNALFLVAFSDRTIQYAQLDDLELYDTAETTSFSIPIKPVQLGESFIRFDDVSIDPGPIRQSSTCPRSSIKY